MSKLLHVVGSPRGDQSRSGAVAASFIEIWKARDRRLDIDTLDLWNEPLPDFDGDFAAAKMTATTGGAHDERTRAAWTAIDAIAARFKAADAYLFTVPMWNGGIPYRLKLYIDLLMQPGILFSFDPTTGYRGLLNGKRAAAIYTSGVYEQGVPAAFGRDFHSSYMDWWLRSIGIDWVETIRYQPTLRTPDPERALQQALSDARVAALRLVP